MDNTSETQTTNLPTVWPSINYADARAAIAFLEEALGFTATLIVANDQDDSIVEHCQMAAPEGGGIMLGTADRPGNKFSQRPTGAASTYVVTSEPDELYDRAVKAGADVFHELEDQDYGSRDFSILDPEGNIWSFGTYRGEHTGGV
jgi:uncharacterized glyoxalase superfamily protein PhnB